MTCLNCNRQLLSNSNFCPECGAKVIKDRLTLKWYLYELNENILKVDNKLFKTFFTLITKPELVVNGYINGLRKKYFAPISFLIVALTVSGLNVFLLKNGYLGEIDYTRFASEGHNATAASRAYMESYMNNVFEYSNVLLFLLVPFLALISKIVFHNIKSFNFLEHLVIYTYTYSLCSIVGFLLIVVNIFMKFDFISFSWGLILLYIVYHMYALKRIFKLNKTQIALKTFLFVPVFLVLYAILILILTILFIAFLLGQRLIET